jgi:hypothetical protein
MSRPARNQVEDLADIHSRPPPRRSKDSNTLALARTLASAAPLDLGTVSVAEHPFRRRRKT